LQMTGKNKSHLSHWNTLLNTDCKVYRINGNYVYPIFKNASSSLHQVHDQVLHNEEITQCDDIHILIRDPADRFVSGINTYTKQQNMEIDEVMKQLKEGELMDRHFSPQWIWLLHLRRFYNGKVTLRAFEKITDYCKLHINKADNKTTVEVPSTFISTDLELIKYFEKSISLDKIIKECKSVLSKA
jgi:hypothetical protein